MASAHRLSELEFLVPPEITVSSREPRKPGDPTLQAYDADTVQADPAVAPTDAASPVASTKPQRRSADDESGKIFAGRYRLGVLLGEGGMGRVYRAHDLVLDEEVAIKFLPAKLAASATHLELFVREVRVARQVSHANVCRVHDISSADDRPFLSVEYIDGEDLGVLLRRIGRLGPDKAIELAHQLCSGLAALHERGILHRDLKPSNVMIDGRGRARITDFGLAALAEELSVAELRDGTPAYQAPEQIEGRSVSIASDIYALGTILFEMFSGERWTDLEGTPEERALEAETRLQPIEAGVAAVVRQCLDPAPEQRPSSALAVAMSLPGGDPLAAAIAAGRLPSPEAVANARTVGGLSTRLGLVALVLTGALLLALAIIHGRHTLLDASVLPPDVLVHRSREILEQIGHEPVGQDARFLVVDQQYAWKMVSSDESQDLALRERLREAPTSPLVFTYRGFRSNRLPFDQRVTTVDPEPGPGDSIVMLDGRGQRSPSSRS